MLHILAAETRRSGEPVRAALKMNFAGEPIGDAGLAELRRVATLQELDLSRTKITDAAAPHLAALRELRIVNLSGTALTDAALPHLVALPNLRELHLGGTAVTDAGAESLAKMPALEELWLPAGVTTAGLTALAQSKSLREVAVPVDRIDDDMLRTLHQLGRLPLLERVRCDYGEPRTSEHVVGIILDGTKVTDEGLKLLNAYPKLEFVNARNSPVTDAGLTELLKTFPDLEVHR
jgi:hypothetical protein